LFRSQGVDNLHHVVSRGIIRDGFAATRTIYRQIPTWQPGGMGRGRSRAATSNVRAVILAVGDFTGLNGHLVAIPFRSLKLDDPSGNIVLPGASRAALDKLPVFLTSR
jgi:hypothetical protein